ncbi:MAG: PfkB family carbohydrate kinase [Lachnospiraceae bacterium]|nr:PfkB family carbohydrate kinase [Lachnospiraceae bacterium]
MSLQKKKAVFIGLTGIDYVYYLDEFPKENGKCKTEDYRKYIGGPAANAAITYAALGGDATLITAYGRSVESKGITDELISYGVNVINVAIDDKLPGTSTICISRDGQRTIISGQNSYETDLSGIDLSEYDLALFDCNQQDISIPLLDRVSCETVLDAGSYKPNVEKFLKKASIVISSEQFRDGIGRDIFEMPYENITKRAMTRGEKSIITKSGEIAVEHVECVDSLAAGDIFHGAFCFAYLEKEYDFKIALEFAAKVASESVKYKGPREWKNAGCF